MKSVLAPAIVAALALATAGQAQAAPPPADTELRLVSTTAAQLIYLAPGTRTRDGNMGAVWVFNAHPTPRAVGPRTVVGSWVRFQADCAANTLGMIELHALDDQFAVAFSSDKPTPPKAVNLEVASGESAEFRYICRNGPPGGVSVPGVRAAVAAAQGH